jgi:predicted GNAT superfamily acetyltransferase
VVSADATTALFAGRTAGAGARDIEIRHVRTHDEFVRCVELQAATWGAGFRESVPATILKITQRLGGVTAGAFTPDGTLLGFIFGVTGIEHGALVHWSDMLAVDARAQNHGIGRSLKEFQRETLRAVGVTRMYWTYDPLVARNAYFNLNRLGARVVEYVEDMYGADTGSALHSGLGTDRFIVDWPIAAKARTEPILRAMASSPSAWSEAPILNADAAGRAPAALSPAASSLPPRARVEIPTDILHVQQTRIADAVSWRQSTRQALQWALANDYAVERFERDASGNRAFYLLSRMPAQAPAAA